MGHWIVDTPGVGVVIALGVAFSVLAAYVRMVRWIQAAPPDRREGEERQG